MTFRQVSSKIVPEKRFLSFCRTLQETPVSLPCRKTVAEMGLPLGRRSERGRSRAVHLSRSWKTSRQFVKWHVSHGGHSSSASPFWLTPLPRVRRFLSFSFPVGQHNASRGISRVYKINPLIVAQQGMLEWEGRAVGERMREGGRVARPGSRSSMHSVSADRTEKEENKGWVAGQGGCGGETELLWGRQLPRRRTRRATSRKGGLEYFYGLG